MKDVFVGLESSTDIWVSLNSLEALLDLSETTESSMGDELRQAYKSLRDNVGDEMPVDERDLEVLIEELKSCSHMDVSIGGGAAIQCSQFLSLGVRAHYLGNYYPSQIKGTLFSGSDFSMARPSELNPRSIVLQFSGDRFILGSGKGRRIADLRDYIESLPRTIAESSRAAGSSKIAESSGIAGRSGKPDAISLVGWHVLFALGVEDVDVDLVVSALKSLRKLEIPMFTDTGGFGKMDDIEIRKLWEIYETFDILAMNEVEFLRLSNVFSLRGDEDERLRELMMLGEKTGTVWLHTRAHQKSVSCKFDTDRLVAAQEFASAAGCLRVETGGFPTSKEIESLSRPGRSSESRGVVKTAGLRSRRVRSEVGAGDVSCASFLWKLLF
ncbi:MAG TPA: hypothetical protein VLB04_10765 [Methanotrichaceae archaeon]|nr:hypothetical protein [Methanotrichaceae archaeon]